MCRGIAVVVVISGLAAFVACEADPEPEVPGAGEAEIGDTYGYEVFLEGILVDTLSGSAAFGDVVADEDWEPQFVIALQDPVDLTDGLFLVRPNNNLEAGTYPVVTEDEVQDSDGFRVVYRNGLHRKFRGTGGEVTLETVSDTLIEGRIDATLTGTFMPPGEAPTEGEVTAAGAFRAEDDIVGFLVGL